MLDDCWFQEDFQKLLKKNTLIPYNKLIPLLQITSHSGFHRYIDFTINVDVIYI